MKTTVIGKCIRGASHIRNKTKCQDSMKKKILYDGTVILAVADGHGSRECLYSKSGSQIAVNVFCQMLSRICEEWKEKRYIYLKREGEITLAREIEKEWKKRVLRLHMIRSRKVKNNQHGNKDYEEVYKLYGTTLLGLLIHDSLVYSFQLGDGDLFMINGEHVENLTKPDKILGTETYSLCNSKAWENVKTDIRIIDMKSHLPVFFTLSTDGFSNSFKNEKEFRHTIRAYTEIIREKGVAVFRKNLSGWLEETSYFGSGDDITFLTACFEE